MSGILVLMLVLAALLQTSKVQTWLLGRLTSLLESYVDGEVSFSQVQFMPANAVMLKDLMVKDTASVTVNDSAKRDTLLYAGTMYATFSLRNILFKKNFHFSRIFIDNVRFSYVQESDSASNFSRMVHLPETDTTTSFDGVIGISKVDLTSLHFTYDNKEVHKDVKGNVNARRIKYSEGLATADLKHADITVDDKWTLSEASASVKYKDGEASVKNLILDDGHTHISIPSTKASISKDGEISFDTGIRSTHLSAWTLTSILPGMGGMSLELDIDKCDVSGTTKDINIKEFSFALAGTDIQGRLHGSVDGINDLGSAGLDATVDQLSVTTRGLDKLIAGFSGKTTAGISKYAEGQKLTLKGNVYGRMSNLDANVKVSSSAGWNAQAKANIINMLTAGQDGAITASLGIKDINIGEIIGSDLPGKCTLEGNLRCSLSDGKPTLDLRSLNIKEIEIAKYNFTNLSAAGKYGDRAFDAHVSSDDPNLALDIICSGKMDSEGKLKSARFTGNLPRCNLHEMGFDPRDSSRVSFRLVGSLNSNDRGMQYNAGIRDIIMAYKGISSEIGDIILDGSSYGEDNSMRLKSSFLDGHFTGTRAITEFIKDIKEASVGRELPVLLGPDTRETDYDGGSYRVSLDFHDSRDILRYIKPGLYIAEGTALTLGLSNNGAIDGKVTSSRIAFKENYVKDAGIVLDNQSGALNAVVSGKEIKISSAKLDNDEIVLTAQDNRLAAGIRFNNGSEFESSADIRLTGDISRDADGAMRCIVSTLPSNIIVEGNNWNINESTIDLSKHGIKVNGFMMDNDEQYISVNGGFSGERADTLEVNVNEFNLSDFDTDALLGMDIDGILTGHVIVYSPKEEDLKAMINLKSEGTSIAGYDAGLVRFATVVDDRHHCLDIALKNIVDSHETLSAEGQYSFKDKSLSLDADMDKFNIGLATPFLGGVFDKFYGDLSGSIHAEGPLDKLELSSRDLNIKDGMGLVSYTNVPYQINGPLHLDSYGLYFDNVDLRDRYDGKAVMKGAVTFDHFNNLGLDVHLLLDKIEGINLLAPTADMPLFGYAYGSGNVDVTGPLDRLRLNVDVVTSKPSQVHIATASMTSSEKTDLLTFKARKANKVVDPYEQMISSLKQDEQAKSEFNIGIKIGATPDATIYVDLDNTSTNTIRANGTGEISVDMNAHNGQLTLGGNYTINQGNAHISVLGITSRDFQIKDGSTVKLNGDVMDTDLDINGLYTLKASLASLIADTTSTAARRTVECGFSITDKIRHPQLKFSINIPDLDPTTKSSVESALNTEDKIQKQFIALLVAGSFIPDEQSGITSNTTVSNTTLYAGAASIMASQLNTIMQKLQIPVDLGLNYQSNEGGTNIFDVAVSTQLFNNKVVVNGNLGSRQNSRASTQSGDFIGNLDIEIKLDKAGQVRFNLFSHSADEYTNFLDNSQRNGIGIVYQREFDTFGDLLRDLFNRKRKEDESPADSPRAANNTETIIIKPREKK